MKGFVKSAAITAVKNTQKLSLKQHMQNYGTAMLPN